jgi:hypothetical protein
MTMNHARDTDSDLNQFLPPNVQPTLPLHEKWRKEDEERRRDEAEQRAASSMKRLPYSLRGQGFRVVASDSPLQRLLEQQREMKQESDAHDAIRATNADLKQHICILDATPDLCGGELDELINPVREITRERREGRKGK